MLGRKSLALILLSCFVAGLNAQILSYTMECVYDDSEILGTERYTCTLSGLDYDFAHPFYFIRVEGQHATGRANEDVRNLRILNSTINRIPALIFTVFPNIEAVEVLNCGVMRFVPPDFYQAKALRELRVVDNDGLSLGNSAFFYLNILETLILDNNNLSAIGATPFTSLVSLQTLSLANNQIRTLTPRMMSPLRNLRTFDVSNNVVEEIDGRLFFNSPLVEIINLSGNRINAVGASIVNINENLQQIWFEGNNCIDQNFVIGTGVDLGTIRENLAECFTNSPFGTQITLNVAGSLVIFDENDQVLLRIE